MEKEKNKDKGKFAIASLILVIVSIISTLLGLVGLSNSSILAIGVFISLICAILAIIFGGIAVESTQKNAGIVSIIIAVIQIVIFWYILYNQASDVIDIYS